MNRTVANANRMCARLRCLCSAMLLIGGATSALAQGSDAFPSRTVKMIVPSAPGGSSDILTRIVTAKLAEIWKQAIVIENRSAANGIVAADAVAKSTPDGYTLLVGNTGTQALNAGLFKKLPYDPASSFAAVARMAVSPSVLIAHITLPVANAGELRSYSKTHETNIAYPGSTGQLAALMLNSLGDMKLALVPYPGSAPSDLSVAKNETQVAFTSLASARTHLQGGRIKLLGVTSLTREPSIPAVPTLDESGAKGYELEMWFGLFAPAGTPKPIIDKMSADVGKVLADPATAKALNDAAYSVAYIPASQFGDYVRRSSERFGKSMRELGIQPSE